MITTVDACVSYGEHVWKYSPREDVMVCGCGDAKPADPTTQARHAGVRAECDLDLAHRIEDALLDANRVVGRLIDQGDVEGIDAKCLTVTLVLLAEAVGRLALGHGLDDHHEKHNP